MLVIDASSALFVAASLEGLAQLAIHEPVAPPLLWSEFTSALSETLYRREISKDLADDMRQQLRSAAITRVVPEELYAEAWRLAERLGWAKTYDAEYVALSRLLGARLLSVDGRLRRGAGHLVDIISPEDL